MSGRLTAKAPLRQSAAPSAFLATTLTQQLLVGVLVEFGIGCGAPNRHPAFVHFSKAHFAGLQVPRVQVPLRKQSVLTVHGEAQSLSTVQNCPRFDTAPCVQRLPPASVGVVPDSVSAGSLHAVTFVSELPMSGTVKGSGKLLVPPPQ